jgi:hypothetical protein
LAQKFPTTKFIKSISTTSIPKFEISVLSSVLNGLSLNFESILKPSSRPSLLMAGLTE